MPRTRVCFVFQPPVCYAADWRVLGPSPQGPNRLNRPELGRSWDGMFAAKPAAG